MRLLLATLFTLTPTVVVAGPDDDARAAVAVELAKLSLRKPVQPFTPNDVPTDLDKPAPTGWEKVKIGDGPWHFRKTAPGVAAPPPFAPDPFGILRTPAPLAGTSPRPGPGRGSFAGTPQAGTFTSAPPVVLSGGTNCPTGT